MIDRRNEKSRVLVLLPQEKKKKKKCASCTILFYFSLIVCFFIGLHKTMILKKKSSLIASFSTSYFYSGEGGQGEDNRADFLSTTAFDMYYRDAGTGNMKRGKFYIDTYKVKKKKER